MESNPSLREHLEKVEKEGPLTEAHKKLLTELREAETSPMPNPSLLAHLREKRREAPLIKRERDLLHKLRQFERVKTNPLQKPESSKMFKFSCPHCGQHIEADVSCVGMEISCPTCGGQFAAPAENSAFAENDQKKFGTSAPARVQAMQRAAKERHYSVSSGISTPDTVDKQNPDGKLRSWLHSFHEFIEKRITTKAGMAITMLLLLVSWFYPPGFHSRDYSHGWFFIFDMSSIMRVDFGRLILLDAIILALAGGFTWAVSRNSPFRNMVIRLAFCSLVAVPLIGLIWGSVILIRDAKRKADQRAAVQAAEAEDRASKVELSALKQISLFDVGAGAGFSRIYGRVRNGLPRAVHKLVLKASFYNAKNEVIEVHNVPLHDTFFPAAPSSFDTVYNSTIMSVWNLPVGYSWRVEVIEAHYVR